MNTNYDKIKSDLLDFGERNGACIGQYQRLYKAESIEDIISVVKDNFKWCIQYKDFADVLMANREQFAEHRIWINQNVEIQEGVGFLLVTEGSINATSYGASTINATSCGTSTINAKSCDVSTINAESYGTSTINAKSCGASTINATSCGTSTINAKSCDVSTINAKSYGASTMIIRTLNIECEVNDRSIARYIYDNRIVIADTSVTVEQYHK